METTAAEPIVKKEIVEHSYKKALFRFRIKQTRIISHNCSNNRRNNPNFCFHRHMADPASCHFHFAKTNRKLKLICIKRISMGIKYFIIGNHLFSSAQI